MNVESFYKQIDDWTCKRVPYFFILDFEKQKPILYSLDEIDKLHYPVSFSFPKIEIEKDKLKTTMRNKVGSLISILETDMSGYRQKFTKTQELFQTLGVDVINLTVPTPIQLHASLFSIYNQAKAKYKVYLENRFVCFTPETFIQIDKQGTISSFPMKGTIDAALIDAKIKILENKKEEEEHRSTVNLIIKELEQVANQVSVKRFRYLDKIKTSNKELYQVSSEVTGKLKLGYKQAYGSLLKKLLPAGSITGFPKENALKIIQEVERYKRSYYTGVCGVFDGDTLDSCVLIRMIEAEGAGYVYKSGGGITKQSVVEDEYNEIKDKIYVSMD